MFGTTVSEAIRSHNMSLYFKQRNTSLSMQRQRLLNQPVAASPVYQPRSTAALFASATGFDVSLSQAPKKIHPDELIRALFSPFNFMVSLYKRFALRSQQAQEAQYFQPNRVRSWIA